MASMMPAGYLDDWIPIEWDEEVIERVRKASAVEATSQKHNMQTATKRVLRASGLKINAGKQYVTDDSDLDYVTLTARRFMSRVAVDEDDLADAAMIVDTLSQRARDWATSYADVFDNACLATTGAENGTSVPFTSVYKSIRTTDSAVGYTANDNYVSWDGAASGAYDKFSETLRLVEVSQYWDGALSLVIAHPSYRDAFRRTKDNNGDPIFIQGLAGTPDTLFGVTVFWSRGARTDTSGGISFTSGGTPNGNALLVFVGDRTLFKQGNRSGPETRVDVSRAHDDFDDTAVKFRVRRGFKVGHQRGFAVLERTA